MISPELYDLPEHVIITTIDITSITIIIIIIVITIYFCSSSSSSFSYYYYHHFAAPAVHLHRQRALAPMAARGGASDVSATAGSHNSDSRNLKSRVSDPRSIAYVHSKIPFESSNLPGSGPIFPD